jgi:3-carboxy-cis,cis-muconate cycloisomerase
MLALPQAFVLTHGALLHARAIAEGMIVDRVRMRQNLEAGGGLIVAEAVMMRLAPLLGRETAHHVVKHACDRVLSDGGTLAEALAREPEVSRHLDRAAIEEATDPTRYLGSAHAFIDRTLERAVPLLRSP